MTILLELLLSKNIGSLACHLLFIGYGTTFTKLDFDRRWDELRRNLQLKRKPDQAKYVNSVSDQV